MLEVCDEVEVVEDSEMQRLPRRVADHAKVTHATSFRSPKSRALHSAAGARAAAPMPTTPAFLALLFAEGRPANAAHDAGPAARSGRGRDIKTHSNPRATLHQAGRLWRRSSKAETPSRPSTSTTPPQADRCMVEKTHAHLIYDAANATPN